MDELIRYIAQYDPAFPGTVRGASADEIARLEPLAGRPLPRSYRAFLATMGHGLGTFDPFPDGMVVSIEELISLYESEPPLYPERYLLIGVDYGGYRMDLFLETLRPETEPRVVRFNRETELVTPDMMSLQAESLPELLFSMAFYSVRMSRLPWQARLVPSEEALPPPEAARRMEEYARTAARLGFARFPYTGPWSPCYDRADAALYCYQPPPCDPSFTVAAMAERECNLLAEVLCDALRLHRIRL